MSFHRNAKLGLAGRYALVCAIEGGMTLQAAAAAFSISPATAHRWWGLTVARTHGEPLTDFSEPAVRRARSRKGYERRRRLASTTDATPTVFGEGDRPVVVLGLGRGKEIVSRRSGGRMRGLDRFTCISAGVRYPQSAGERIRPERSSSCP